MNALVEAGLKINRFNEFPFSLYNCIPDMVKLDEYEWIFRYHKKMTPNLFQ